MDPDKKEDEEEEDERTTTPHPQRTVDDVMVLKNQVARCFEYQQRLMMENVVSAEDQKEIDRKNRRRWICRCCCPLILVAVILGIVLPTTKTQPKLITRPPTDSPTTTDPPTAQSEYSYLADLLEPISGDKIYNEKLPQYEAMNWLLNEDPAIMLDIKSVNTTALVNRYALATIYYATDGPNWVDQLDFLSNKSICDWHVERNGILCPEDDPYGDPMFLRLHRNGLNGTIPGEVSAISSLTHLSFAQDWTTLTGPIPSELGLLTQLTLLQVAATAVTGTIPSELNNILSLELLSFAYSESLTGPLPKIIEEDNSIQGYYFSNCNFTGTVPKIKAQSELVDLDLSQNNHLTGTLPLTFYSQPNLKYCNFAETQLGGTLARQFSLLSDLEDVWWSDAQVTGELPTNIGDMDRLKNLRLSNNDMSGTLPTQLGRLDRMVSLHLDGNNFSGTIPAELVNLRDLKSLRLAGNHLLEGTIPTGLLERLPDLKELTLNGTQLTGDYLNESFCQLPVLTTSIAADCAGDTPDMPCDCCVYCCADDVCELNLFGECSIQAGIATVEERNNTCTCPPDGSKFTCVETCQVCDIYGEVCAKSTGYEITLDETTGDKIFFENSYIYTEGPYEGTTVRFTSDVSSEEGSCNVYVNGAECNSCNTIHCTGDDTGGYNVNCENVGGGSHSACDPHAFPRGPLDVLLFRGRGMGGILVDGDSCLPLFPTSDDLLNI